MVAVLWSFLIILAALLCAVIFVLVRVYILSHRRGSFRTMLRITQGPGSEQGWMRGYACYGQTNMAWSALMSFRVRPDLLLPRTSLDLRGTPLHDPETGTATLFLGDDERSYEMVLSTGDYEGLVSWVTSAPPQSH